MTKANTQPGKSMLDQIKEEYAGMEIPEEPALKIHEVAAILKGEVTDNGYEAICTAFKLGYARAKRETEGELELAEIDKLIDSAEARVHVLELAMDNESSKLPEDILETYINDLGDIMRELAGKYNGFKLGMFRRSDQE